MSISLFSGFSSNGDYLALLVSSGDFVVWTKDSDQVRFISGFPNLSSILSSCKSPKEGKNSDSRLSISDDASFLALVISGNRVFVWERERASLVEGKGRTEEDSSSGWTEVLTPFRSADLSKIFPPSSVDHPELTIDSDFRVYEGLSRFKAAWCYSEPDHLRFVYLTLTWNGRKREMGVNDRRPLLFPNVKGKSSFRARWEWNHLAWSLFLQPESSFPLPETVADHESTSEVPFSPISRKVIPPSQRGSLLASLSSSPLSSSILALALNRSESQQNRILFLTYPWSGEGERKGTGQGGFLQTSLYGSGASEPLEWNRQWFWTTSIEWSADALLLYVLTQQVGQGTDLRAPKAFVLYFDTS